MQDSNLAEDPRPPLPGRWPLRPWMGWLGLALALVSGMVVAWYVVDGKARRRLAEARQAFVIHALPGRIEELLPPDVAHEENAEGLLREVWQMMTGAPDWERDELLPAFAEIEKISFHLLSATNTEVGSPPDDSHEEQRQKLKSLLQDPTVRSCLEKLHAAASRTTWHRHLDYSKGAALLLPHLKAARYFVRLLAVRGLAREPTYDEVAAGWDDLTAALQLAQWVDVEPTLISFLTGVACRASLESAAVSLLASAHAPPSLKSFLAQHQQAIVELPEKLFRAVCSERLCMYDGMARDLESRDPWLRGLQHFDGFPQFPRWADTWLVPILSKVAKPRLHQELAALYEFQLRTELAARAHGLALVPELSRLRDDIEQQRHFLAPILIPALTKIAQTHLVQCTRQRMLFVLATAIEQQPNSRAWPTGTDGLGLARELTADTCSGQPLQFVLHDPGPAVYAFGFDGDDDGGRPVNRSDMPDGDGDIVLRIPQLRSANATSHAD